MIASCVCPPMARYACGHCWHDTCLDCGQCAAPGCVCHCELGFAPAEDGGAPRLYLGAHQPHWLALAGVPLFVSHRRLADRRRRGRAPPVLLTHTRPGRAPGHPIDRSTR